MKEKEKYYFITYQIQYVDGIIGNFNVITNRNISDWYSREMKQLRKYNKQPKESKPHNGIERMIILFFKELTKEEYLELEENTNILKSW